MAIEIIARQEHRSRSLSLEKRQRLSQVGSSPAAAAKPSEKPMSTTLNDSALPSRSGREVEFSRWVEKVYCFRHFLAPRRRSQVVRQRSAKPLFVGSIPTGASKQDNELTT